MKAEKFQERILNWYHQHGRKDLPWQLKINPYKVWLSEIMLQQTQVRTVIPYFEKFLEAFPDVHSLAQADLDKVLSLWAGLGYYARARNLHKTAQLVSRELKGQFPADVNLLAELPGIGLSTAGAIVATAFEKSATILDGNVKRVLARHFAIAGWPGQANVLATLWDLAKQLTPTSQIRNYTQAMMDLGATICTRTKPLCNDCPIKQTCCAFAEKNQLAYPGKKSKTALPIKNTVILVIENEQQEIYLTKRPPTGIWGGLWSLPEFADLPEELPDNLTPLITFRHTFSHYHLDIQAFHLPLTKLKTINVIEDNANAIWLSPDQFPAFGKAAAIEKILHAYLRRAHEHLAQSCKNY